MTERIIKYKKIRRKKNMRQKGVWGGGTKRKKNGRKYEYRKWIKLCIWLRIHRQLGKKVHS